MAGLDSLTFATYNMHGFKQGHVYLQDLCKQFNIVFVQEHWLAPFNLLDIQDLCPDSICILSSAMNDVTAAGVLKGRPFGGVGILIDKSVCSGLRVITKADRYIIVQLNELLLINVYLPCASAVNEAWREDYLCTLASISNDISAVNYKYLIFGGDLNVDIRYQHTLRDSLFDFFDELNIVPTFTSLSNTLNSFCVDSTGACSLIDHFVISANLVNSVAKLDIVDSGVNFSDHCAVVLHVNVPTKKVTSNVSNERNQAATYCLRWDKANLALYFDMSHAGLNNINVPWYLLYPDSSTDKSEIMNDIDRFYDSIVSVLSSTAECVVPKRKSSFYKFWWDMDGA